MECANIISIYKKGTRSDPGDYRPISLTSICCKLLEHIIYSSISKHLSSFSILSPHQYGFQTSHSCDTQLLGAINNFHHCLDSGSHIDSLFLDFSKAFDKVSHRKLYHKLSHCGINGSILRWIRAFLTDRSQSVLLEGKSSTSHPVYLGVPQGSLLAALLFLIYINDITESITSTIRLYADDVLIYREINTDADLQNDFHTLEKWQMKFDPSKCVHLALTRKKSHIKFHYEIHSQQIQQTK